MQQYRIHSRLCDGVYVASQGMQIIVLKEKSSLGPHEAEALRKVNHRSIISYCGEDDKHIRIRYATGRSVEEICEREPTTERFAISVGKDMCDAALHLQEKGFVYNDWSSLNVHVSDYGILVDLGGALPTTQRQVSRLRSSPGFQCKDHINRINAPENDVFGIGALLYFMLHADTPQLKRNDLYVWNVLPAPQKKEFALKKMKERIQVRPLLHQKLERLVYAMLEPEAGNRPTVGEATKELAGMYKGKHRPRTLH